MVVTDEFIDATIANMKVIGMLPKNGKLCVRKGQLALDTAQAQALRRWINGDSRDSSLMHAKNTLNNAMKITRLLMAAAATANDDMARWTLQRLVVEMEQCETGMQNLKTTYANDSMMIANLDVLIERQSAHRSEVMRFLCSDSSTPTPTPTPTSTPTLTRTPSQIDAAKAPMPLAQVQVQVQTHSQTQTQPTDAPAPTKQSQHERRARDS
jgi:hypothetical protein